MDAGRAGGEQLAALARRVLHADGLHAMPYSTTASSSFRMPQSLPSMARGMPAPHIEVNRFTCAKLATGMIPGTIGQAMPAFRARAMKST